MKKIEITLSEEQYLTIQNEINRCSKMNLDEGTLTGFQFALDEYFPGLTSLTFTMHEKINLGDVIWEITDSE